jgi:hypothetical protein
MGLCADALALGVVQNAKRLDEGLYLEMAGAEHRPARATPTPARSKPSSTRR